MSKYQPLWKYIKNINKYPLKLSFGEIAEILGFEIDHSFLTYKKEATAYGFIVEKISMKGQTVTFNSLTNTK